MSDERKSLPAGAQLVFALLATLGIRARVKGVTGSTEVAFISVVILFGVFLAKGDDIFKVVTSMTTHWSDKDGAGPW